MLLSKVTNSTLVAQAIPLEQPEVRCTVVIAHAHTEPNIIFTVVDFIGTNIDDSLDLSNVFSFSLMHCNVNKLHSLS